MGGGGGEGIFELHECFFVNVPLAGIFFSVRKNIWATLSPAPPRTFVMVHPLAVCARVGATHSDH